MKQHKITEKEYEALATMRDIAILLYSEISENIGHDSAYLSNAFEYLDALTKQGERDHLA